MIFPVMVQRHHIPFFTRILETHAEAKRMSMSNNVDLARKVATEVHRGQTDKSGIDYIRHPERVAERLETDELKVVGWLHDVVEDTGVSVSELRSLFGDETVKAVLALTHREGEMWEDYIARVKENPVAVAVKISDLIDNSNLSRLNPVTVKDVLRQKKYNEALLYLMT